MLQPLQGGQTPAGAAASRLLRLAAAADAVAAAGFRHCKRSWNRCRRRRRRYSLRPAGAAAAAAVLPANWGATAQSNSSLLVAASISYSNQPASTT